MSGGGGGSDEIKPTEEEKALADVAIERWNEYQEKIVPYENRYMEQVQRTEGDYAMGRGQGAVSVEQAFAPARKEQEKNLFSAGVRPGSGSHVMQANNLNMDKAQSRGVGVGEGHMAVQGRHLAGLQNIVNLGEGQAADAQTGLSSIASGSATDARHRASLAADARAGRRNLAGNLLGAGTRYGLRKLEND